MGVLEAHEGEINKARYSALHVLLSADLTRDAAEWDARLSNHPSTITWGQGPPLSASEVFRVCGYVGQLVETACGLVDEFLAVKELLQSRNRAVREPRPNKQAH